jgi:protein SCO1/2
MKHAPSNRAALLALALFGVTGAYGVDAPPAPPVAHEVMPPAAAIPGESIYQLPLQLTLQDGRQMPLAALRGQPLLVTMFYTTCQGVCPLMAFTLRRTMAALPEAERARMRVLMVSFDPARDSPEALRGFAELNSLKGPAWLLARTEENDVRELAAVLGIRYRQLPGGMFSHSAIITLLDADGLIRTQTGTLQETDPALIKAIGDVLR